MKRLDVAPRTPDWYRIRSESWTASVAAVLVVKDSAVMLRDYAATKGVTLDIEPILEVGLMDFYGNTPWTVWADKMGKIPRFRGNAHTERGTTNEEFVLKNFERNEFFLVEREVTVLHKDMGWLLASYDGLAPPSSDRSVVCPNGFPVEAKCPAYGSRKKLFDSRKAGKLAIMGLPYYWCQVQHQIAVADAPYGWFTAAGVEPDAKTGELLLKFPITEKVPRDERFIKAYLPLAEFYHSEFIDNFVEPPMLDSDRQLMKELTEKAAFDKAVADQQHDVAVDLYLEAFQRHADAKKLMDELEERVLGVAAGLRVEGSDLVLLDDRLQVTYSKSQSTSWQKVAKALASMVGMTEIPADVLEKCKGSAREQVKLKEVV